MAMVIGSALVAPARLQAADPPSEPPAQPEMFRGVSGTSTGTGTGTVSPNGSFPTPVVGHEFHESTMGFSNLFQPTSIAFAPDGRVFVAEKRGVVAVYDSVSDTSPTTYADLTTNVQDFWDRGLLGLTLDPDFMTNGRVYIVYTFNHVLGDPQLPPKWFDDTGNDDCPTPPGATTDGCVVSGRLSRLDPTSPGGPWDGNEHVLVEDWCQVHPSHSIGKVAFGPEGALYAGGGDGASFNSNIDYGQDFNPANDLTPDNPCGDPPSPVGTALSPPSAEGGTLRSQDMRTMGDPVGLAGTIIRVDPDTGDGWPTNANSGSPDPNARRIVAYGLRNPFRFTFRPGTNELWIGDVGQSRREEIDRVQSPSAEPPNFGWPCTEGDTPNSPIDALDLTICENLYDDGTARDPFYSYRHSQRIVAGEPCPSGSIGGSVISGTSFYPTGGGPFPAAYDGALFFADYARNCIWSMPAGPDGLPDPKGVATFASALSGPVDLEIGPDGALYYVGFDDSRIHRITVSPSAIMTADQTSSPTPPLHVQFDGSASTDPKGGVLAFAWDLDGDGAFDDSAGVEPEWTYTEPGVVVARLRVTDEEGIFDIAAETISVGNSEPVATIGTPPSSRTWSVGDTITFNGSATDNEDGAVPGSRLTWTVFIQHCPSACHSHTLKTNHGSSGFVVAPDHGFPSSIEIRLVARDSDGTDSQPVSVTLQPKTVDLQLISDPPGVALAAGEQTSAAPFTATVINKSLVEVSAPPTATINGRPYGFAGWSDGKAAAHSFTATASTPPLIATYAPGTTYVPIEPVRVVDTRSLAAGPLRAGVGRTFAIAGTHGIPTGAVAVTGNLTAVNPTKAGWIGLTSDGGMTPTTSALNLPAGDIRANGVTMLLGNRRLTMTFNAPSGSAHAILDVTGYFLAANSGATFTPIGPTRVLDSRSGIGGVAQPFASSRPRSLKLAGANGIPSDAVAVTGNLTVTGHTAAGYVAMTTALTATPAVSTINVPVGDTRANGLTIKLNASGRASLVYVGGLPGARADLIFDVSGYYRPGTAGLRFYPIDPRRIFDTRSTDTPALRAGNSRSIGVVGASTIPDDAAAVAANVTVVGQTKAGYVSVTTFATTKPTTSTINVPLGDIRANNIVNALNGGGGMRAIYVASAAATTQFIVDLAGYFR